ncbi:hypothetical protein [Prolixibacter sp. SD074]|uniref:hypothetical protein n=1 Tax=Prolixibacter sp. SD074 TaxID=2652391 RepID=UPI00127A445C|nr:hypothetical protein [Prolixibacter sp. SD074]GET30671.1 hypothetical protein SD074_28730 [Prolixibacter sp. SD074]
MKKILAYISLLPGAILLLMMGSCTMNDNELLSNSPNNTSLIVSEELYPNMDALLPKEVIAYEYDNQGYLDKKLYYDAKTGMLARETVFQNDGEGRTLKALKYQHDTINPSGVQLVSTREFEYADNKLQSEYIVLPGGERLLDVKYIYGRDQLERKVFYRAGEVLYYDAYEYKRDGNLDNVTRFTPSEYVMSWIEYKYDSNQRKSVMKYSDHTGAVYKQEFFHYNSDGELRLVEHQNGLLSGNHTSTVTRYSYM